jgi:hypothetical protein
LAWEPCRGERVHVLRDELCCLVSAGWRFEPDQSRWSEDLRERIVTFAEAVMDGEHRSCAAPPAG